MDASKQPKMTERNQGAFERPGHKREMQGKFAEEYTHFDWIEDTLATDLQEAEASIDQIEQSYQEAKRYSITHRHDIDPKELFQNELLMQQIERSGNIALEAREKLKKLIDSPYFARIDFTETGIRDSETHYIGRFSHADRQSVLISDWRSPVAGMFYDFDVGPAGYAAPSGRIEGRLTRKRQFRIIGGAIDYILESDTNIQDEVLQRTLSQTGDEGMKSIIATIQREQNHIIRNEQAGTILIQGVAGSGKTSIALHRVAFLLYRIKGTLASSEVAILSPNKVFGDFISGVLPELGEEPIAELEMADIAQEQLEGTMAFLPPFDASGAADAAFGARMAFKATTAFVEQVKNFLWREAAACLAPTDYVFGDFVVSGAAIAQRFAAYKRLPYKKRLRDMAADILSRFQAKRFLADEAPKKGEIYKALLAMLRYKTPLALYRAFFAAIGRPEMLVVKKKTLEWPDVFPYLYFMEALEGLQRDDAIKHLVIDEMQDYTPIQYAVINTLYRCDKTILGDFGQSIQPGIQGSLETLAQLYPKAQVVRLTKSYRSTYEIIDFARRMQPDMVIDPMERHGRPVEVVRCGSAQEEWAEIKKRIRLFQNNGRATMGILVKTNQEAEALHQRLAGMGEIHLLVPGESVFESGVSIASIQMAKGLEFDEVLIPFVNEAQYKDQQDKSLLYVACTRAMHDLALCYTGVKSALIP